MTQLRILGFEAGIFIATQALALYIGSQFIAIGARDAAMIESTGTGIGMFIAALLLSTLMIILLIKYLNSKFIFQLLFAWLIFVGSLAVFEVLVGEPLAMTLAVMLVILRFMKPLVIVQNIAMIVAIGGISPQLAMFFSTPTLIAVLIFASIYDYIAVFKTKHMITLFEGLIEHKTPFTILIPDKGSLFQNINTEIHKRTERGREFFLLGTGDIAFPAIFAISVLADYGFYAAIAVIFGSLLGLFADHFLLMRLKKPIPALPFISAFSLGSFALALLFL